MLASDGDNLVSVLARLSQDHPGVVERINDYLRVILPGLVRVRTEPVQTNGALPTDVSKRALVFEQALGEKGPHLFWPSQMSDGTRRALAVLTAFAPCGRRRARMSTERKKGLELSTEGASKGAPPPHSARKRPSPPRRHGPGAAFAPLSWRPALPRALLQRDRSSEGPTRARLLQPALPTVPGLRAVRT